VLFDPSEIEVSSYHVPSEFTEIAAPNQRAMMGTNQLRPRCVALAGKIGEAVSCSNYDRRPSCCREFVPSFENGVRNRRCDKARQSKGLKPLKPEDWPQLDNPEIEPKFTA